MYNHTELTKIASNWLKNSVKCPVVGREIVANTVSREIPDAIGWKSNCCYLVECKVSKKDFYKDKKKLARQEGFPALGNKRIYIAPKNVINPDLLPENWSLYEVNNNGKVRYSAGPKVNEPGRFSSCRTSESRILLSIVRRLNNWNSLIIENEKN